MQVNTAMGIMQQALTVSLFVPGPILLGILVVGLIISIFQAATQIHEMTLVFIPKVLLTSFILYVGGSWMLSSLVGFAHNLFLKIPMMVQ